MKRCARKLTGHAILNWEFSPQPGKGAALPTGEEVIRHVILSEAKDLHLLVFQEKLQMLRCAQHDR